VTPSYDANEKFSGSECVTHALVRLGLRVTSHDIEHHHSMNILCPAGFVFFSK
jgi:hypothetical protein